MKLWEIACKMNNDEYDYGQLFYSEAGDAYIDCDGVLTWVDTCMPVTIVMNDTLNFTQY